MVSSLKVADSLCISKPAYVLAVPRFLAAAAKKHFWVTLRYPKFPHRHSHTAYTASWSTLAIWLLSTLSMLFSGSGDGLFAAHDPDIETIAPVDSSNKLASRFFREYPEATARLEKGLQNLKCSARYRKLYHTKRDTPWIESRIYIAGENVRYHRYYTDPTIVGATGRLPYTERAVLWTPSLSGIVYDPFTGHYSTCSISETASDTVKRMTTTQCMKFIKSPWGVYGKSFLERMQDGSWTVEEITAVPSEGQELVVTSFRHRWGPDDAASSQTVVTYSPNQDWSVKTFKMSAGPPLNSEITAHITVQKVPNSYILDTVRFDILRYTDNAGLPRSESELFEVKDVRMGALSDSDFTLKSLGVEDQRQRHFTYSRVLWWVAGNGMFLSIIVLIVTARRKIARLNT